MERLVRPYVPADRERCLALFDGNVPDFFDASERADFADFLNGEAVGLGYLVVEQQESVVACGGLMLSTDGRSAHFCWGMVARECQRTGLGSVLTRARLDAAALPGVEEVRLDTSQHTAGFYARFGFEVERVTADFYGPGLDRLDMVLRLPRVMR